MSARVDRVIRALVGPVHGGRFAALDGYRGLAAFGVLVYHVRGATVLRGEQARGDVIDNLGNFGVALFFLLSGFLLYRPFSQAMIRRRDGSSADRPLVGRFLLRRFLRVYPAYWLALVGWAFVANEAKRESVKPLRAFFLFGHGFNGLGVAWSLYVEVVFYVFVPVVGSLLWLACRRRRAATALLAQLAVLVAMTAVAYVFRFTVVVGEGGDRLKGTMFPNYLDWFALGMLLAVLSAWQESGYRLPRSLTGLADRAPACFALGAVCYGWIVVILDEAPGFGVEERPAVYASRFTLQAFAAFFFLLPAVLGSRPQRTIRVLAASPLAALGSISYGVYLWHTIAIKALDITARRSASPLDVVKNIVVVSAITIVVATLSYRLLERPALKLAEPARPRRRTARRNGYLGGLNSLATTRSHGGALG